VIEESPAIKLIDELLRENIKITVYDPLAIDNVRALYGDQLAYALSMEECIRGSALWIVTIPLDEFRPINSSFVTCVPTIIIDCWRIIDKEKLGSNVKYVPLGKHSG